MVLVDGLGYDIKQVPRPPEYKSSGPILSFFQNMGLVILFSLIVFVFVNFPAYFLISKYKVKPSSVSYELAQNKSVQGNDAIGQPNQYPDNTLFIPKIGVKATVSWNVNQDNILDILPNSLVHINGSGKPQENKNIFITGHSSNYWWKEGNYNTVFSLFPQLKEGDEIILTYQGKFNYYKVRELRELKKSEVSKYTESDKEQLTLMTCVPVGTNLHRLLVFADPVKK
ncbi:MAG: sortase [Candidatus Berkelbacteria bacterium]|nr:sortase [Candidatus Berkelbacteria bacterium]